MFDRMTERWGAIVLMAIVIALVPAQAHHGPEEMIAVLTERMKSSGETPVLLYKRANEWRTLGESDEAVADLRRALEQNPRFVDGIEMLAEVHLMRGEFTKALRTAQSGVEVSRNGREVGACQMVAARTLQKMGKPEEALAACEKAFASFPVGNIDWYLVRGVLQRDLGLHEQRIADFRDGYEETRSVVLRNFMVDATIDAGRAEEVLPMINEQVAACRLKSSWLMRRARALWSLDRKEAAREDLAIAVTELERRLHPIRPDVTLVIDRGVARAMLDDVPGSKEDRERARELGATPPMLTLLEEAIKASEADQTSSSADGS